MRKLGLELKVGQCAIIVLMMTMCGTETERLLMSCTDLESRLQRRRADLEHTRDFQEVYRQKMSAHRQAVESVETSLTSKHETRQLHERLQQLNAHS